MPSPVDAVHSIYVWLQLFWQLLIVAASSSQHWPLVQQAGQPV